MSFSFHDREDISADAPLQVSPHVAKGATAILEGDPTAIYGSLKDSFVISCSYWLLNITDSTNVTYHRAAATGIKATSAGQQGAAFVALAYMMGLVKEPTKENGVTCTKRWAAGLASVHKTSMLPDTFTTEVWRFIVDTKPVLYCRSGVRQDIISKYLATRSNKDNEPALVRAVMCQLDLVYTGAYLKSVNLMGLFTASGSRALEIPSVTREAMNLDRILERIRAQEGENYPTCRLLDNNKYPELNRAHYPNLYAATLDWARRSRKVQKKQVLGSKHLIDQASNQDMVRKVLKMTAASIGTASLTDEQMAWLDTKGYKIPDIPLSDLLREAPKHLYF